MRTPGLFDFASIERARRILETDMLQFLIASVLLQSAENNSYEGCCYRDDSHKNELKKRM